MSIKWSALQSSTQLVTLCVLLHSHKFNRDLKCRDNTMGWGTKARPQPLWFRYRIGWWGLQQSPEMNLSVGLLFPPEGADSPFLLSISRANLCFAVTHWLPIPGLFCLRQILYLISHCNPFNCWKNKNSWLARLLKAKPPCLAVSCHFPFCEEGWAFQGSQGQKQPRSQEGPRSLR